MMTKLSVMGMLICLSLLAAPLFAAGPVDDHTLAYWALDEGSGDTTADATANENHGDIEDAEWVEGISGPALLFDGKSARVVVPDSPSLHSETGDISIEAWIKVASDPKGWPNAGPMVFKQDAYQWNVNANGALWFGIWGARLESIGTYDFSEHIDEWHHAALTFEGKSQTARIYVDGDLNIEGQVVEAVDRSAAPLYIGFKEDGGSYFDGIIDEVRISDVVRTEAEIEAFMEKTLAVSSRGKLATLWADLRKR